MVPDPKRDFPSIGASPSGKAPDFDSGIRRFESFRPSHPTLLRSFGWQHIRFCKFCRARISSVAPQSKTADASLHPPLRRKFAQDQK
jgi:hypothetical protein